MRNIFLLMADVCCLLLSACANPEMISPSNRLSVERADGDSFSVKTPDGLKVSVNLGLIF